MRAWVGALTALVLVLPAGAAAAETAPPALAGTNVLSGAAAGRMQVRLTRDALLDLTAEQRRDGDWTPAALHVAGRGRDFIGFVLAERGTTDGFLAVALQTPSAIRDGDRVHRAMGVGRLAQEDRPSSGDAACVQCRVPAGDYDLFFLGRDGNRVTLTLDGLEGKTRLSPPRRVYPWGTGHEPHEFDTVVAGGGAHSTGMGSSVGDRGLFISTYHLTVTATTPIVALADDCHGTGDREECADHTLTGVGAAVGGLHVMSDVAIADGVHAGMTYNVVGNGRVSATSDLLFLPFSEKGHIELPTARPAVRRHAVVF